ncbi:MAG: hypothetical protein ACKVQA_17245, partial [Burkholderiales bacterium]
PPPPTRLEQRRFPERRSAPHAPRPPAAEPRPHIFEGIGRGAAVRDSSVRGHISSERIPGASPRRQPHSAVPAPQQDRKAIPRQPSKDGEGRQPRQQQR